MIAQGSMLLHELGQALPYPRRRIDLGGHIHLQKFFAAAVTEHADQGVIHFNEASVGRGEEEAFLDVVKQFAIAPLRFTPIGNILENMNGLKVLVICTMNAGSGDEISAFEYRMNIIVGTFATSAERTSVRRSFTGQGLHRAHVEPD